RIFFRRLDPLNSAAIAALILLIARPLALRDSSFQLTFAAIGCLVGLAAPWGRISGRCRDGAKWRETQLTNRISFNSGSTCGAPSLVYPLRFRSRLLVQRPTG